MNKKGHRLVVRDAYDIHLTAFFLFVSFLSPLFFYFESFVRLSEQELLQWGGALLSGDALLTLGILMFLYRFVPFFKAKRDYRLVLHYLLSNNFHENIPRKEGKGKRIQLPAVYVKKQDYATISVTIELTGKLMREADKIPNDLEKLFFADFKEKHAFKENRIFSKHAYTQFVFSDNKVAQRLPLEQLGYDKKKGIRLMEGDYWDFVHAPHLLIAGGTGGGKSIFLLALLKVLASFSLLEICDPKKSDLSVLENFEVFKGHVHSEIEEMIDCLKKAVEFMENRYRQMGVNTEHVEDIKIGNHFQNYELPPMFILIDEWTAFYTSLDSRKTKLVDDLMAQLILKGRQAGVFLIVAMQRPDAEYLSANLRDNMMARLALGKLSKTGYRMIFGEDYANKNYLYIKKKSGRGYAALDGGMPSEFYSPLVPFDTGFRFEALFAKMKPLQEEQKRRHGFSGVEPIKTLLQAAQDFQLSATTLTRITHYLIEAGVPLKGREGKLFPEDCEKVEEVIQRKLAYPKENWKKAVQAISKDETYR
ncbi:FtsK/SpoIIIE domain-containing protein [Lactococcus garvieae]|uniref:FtsK/SpoIIIE domain-containing protein n=1 Tax=Lactococcus garvieae TaxID=1363 RepID=UPI0030CE86E6